MLRRPRAPLTVDAADEKPFSDEERLEGARRWNAATKAEQDAWVENGTIAAWRLIDNPLVESSAA